MDNLTIASAHLFSRNFAGAAGKFNNEGNRNFCVIIPTMQDAEDLQADGWNVRWLNPKDPNDEPQPFLQVCANFGKFPPDVWLINSYGKTRLSEDELRTLDWAEFENVDLVIRPRKWEMGGKSGIKGYLKAGYFTIREDPFAYKYRDIPDSAQSSIVNNGR